MIRKLAFLAACTSLLAVAKAPERSLQVVTTETVDFNGGTLHLNSTYGELNVETWDEPRIEITLTRTAFRHAASSDQESGKAFLNRIKLTVQKAANGDVTVSTQFPGRNRLVRAVWGLGDFNL
ncbi:MAG TPA: hypothetical protein VG456_13645, partial [Candidatus Sulfopaludibacter sp.]|nr:hypothetical protein [Candidatus Sulfopaludibacter sp.]